MNQFQDWDPNLYLKFKNERTQPSIDLIQRIQLEYTPQHVIDIGCGPGNSSPLFIQRWPKIKLHGLDNSPNMIEKAKLDYPAQDWILSDASTFKAEAMYDIVFANASIQWIPNHSELIAKLCSWLNPAGVLAVQIPMFHKMPLGEAIDRISNQKHWQKYIKSCANIFTFHECHFYYDLLSRYTNSIEMWETNYIHILESHQAILEWIKSTALRPYLACLDRDEDKQNFLNEVLKAIQLDYPLQQDEKVLFPFRRLFFIAHKSK